MRILHISWEYPPLLYGGLGRHVHALAEHEAKLGHDVTVLTQQPTGAPSAEVINGVNIVRVAPPTPAVPRIPEDLLGWTRDLDTRLALALPEVVQTTRPDVVHAHDWVVARSAMTAASAPNDVPLVTTIHATEAGRHQGWVNNPLSQQIHEIEFRLANRTDRVIACSRSMCAEIHRLFATPEKRIDVIPNGIDLASWDVEPESTDPAAARPTIIFTGRLEWEKGVHVLLEAVRLLPPMLPHCHVMIAGTGTREEILKEEYRDLTDSGTATFLGAVSESTVHKLVSAADVAVVPSIYEPFGLVALEAAAVRTPLIVADVGGLADIVTNGVTGRVVSAQDANALSHAIADVFANLPEARSRADRLRNTLHTDYDWQRIAGTTVASYLTAIADHPTHSKHPAPPVPPPSPENLLRS